MSAQQFSLRWNNYSTHITNALDDLRAEDELTDVTLCAEGNKIRAHKLLLSACSTFFRETFRENPCQHPVIILKGVSFIDLQAVVTFMYNGQVNVTQERLQCFLQTAEMLQIKGLTDMNEKHEDGLIPPPTNNTTKKRVAPLNSSVDARSNTPDNVQRPLTPNSTKRRKIVVKTEHVPPQPDRSNAGSAYNSPGPSSTTGNADGLAGLMSHIQSDSNSVEAEDYPADGGLLNYDDQEGLGEEEDEYSNNLSEENDNSMQDLSGVEQGAIDSDVGGGGALYEETEVMVLEGGGYDIVTYSDSEEMPSLSPAYTSSISNPNTSSFSKPKPKLLLRPFDPLNSPHPIPISTSTSHINILRRRRPEPLESELVNPLESAQGSRLAKPQSPFVGDPMMCPESGETMFPCLMCDKKYKLKSSLESHVKVHEGSENTCSICGQTMSRQRDLKRHVATVHRGLLMADGTITYPPDIDELVPARARGKKGIKREFDPDGLEYYSPETLLIQPDLSSLQ